MESLETIFVTAQGISDAAERSAYLAQSCGGDMEMHARVEAMLRDANAAGDYFGSTEATQRDSAPVTEGPGTVIGRYKLLQKIGEGGMGVVYMAEQREPMIRKVALKIIKAGMDTRQVVARFEAERQALALMDHPNIAKVLDGGMTESGRPYFVMDLVQGLPITQFCDEAKLSTLERLDLLLNVCSAIQHAHQKGIIHRDIKPSNILVTLHGDKAVPKVIDFGIAKATQQRLTDKTLFTQFQNFIGTPAYMSPEQASLSGLDIDTRSDIYALGVLLYELLTGKTPFDGKELLKAGLDEMRRTIKEKEPLRPSTRLSTLQGEDVIATAKRHGTDASKLVTLIRGDLDWIAMKCLEKDRTRRYETADALATDIRRHIRNETVLARPPSKVYRLQKVFRRNKVAFAGAAAVMAALLVGLAASTWLYFREKAAHERAAAAEARAQTQAARSTQVARFLKEMLESVGPSQARGRDTTMLREILDKTAERIGKDLSAQPEVQIELLTTLSETYRELGLYREAEKMARQALQLANARYGKEHLVTARALVDLAWALHGQNRATQPEALIREALAVQQRLSPRDDPAVADTLDKFAQVLRLRGKFSEAEKTQREAIAIKKKVSGGEHPTLPRSLNTLGTLTRQRGDKMGAEALFREAIALSEKLNGKDDPERAMALDNLGEILKDQKRFADAEGVLREALACQERILSADHPDLSRTLGKLGSVLKSQNQLAQAESFYRRAFAIVRKAFGDAKVDVDLISSMASLFETQTNHAGLSEIAGLYRELGEKGNAEAYLELARMYAQGRGVPKRDTEATQCYLKALDLLRAQAETEGTAGSYTQYRIATMYREGRGVVKDTVEATKWFRRAAEQGYIGAQNDLGVMYYEGKGVPKDYAESVKWFRLAAEDGWAEAQMNLGNAYLSGAGVVKDPNQAIDWYRKAAAQGHAEAYYQLGKLFEAGTVVPKDITQAAQFYLKLVEIYREKAKTGDSQYKDRLGNLYRLGKGVAKDPVEAAKWYRAAAEEGNKYAQKSLGELYRSGEGVPQDFGEAAKWFRLAADQGYDWSQYFLGNAYLNGEGVTKDAAEALNWYRKAAAQGHSQAELKIALMYARGEGVSKDDPEATKWYAKAAEHYRQKAEQGELYAQQALAVMYAVGRGVPRSETEAEHWYGKALEQYRNAASGGDAEALNNLAWLLATADSPAIRDGRKAVEVAKKAVAASARTNGSYLDTLAAAYAEVDDFEKAVKTQKEAQPLLRESEWREFGAAHLKLYEAKTPYRQRE